mmetsp:Transcript_92880/g.277135  ORF Transcript_92880/g.277135 Transcript_92880/m.277135 type:complete len:241 (-) Transcript_92880:246-968(-)
MSSSSSAALCSRSSRVPSVSVVGGIRRRGLFALRWRCCSSGAADTAHGTSMLTKPSGRGPGGSPVSSLAATLARPLKEPSEEGSGSEVASKEKGCSLLRPIPSRRPAVLHCRQVGLATECSAKRAARGVSSTLSTLQAIPSTLQRWLQWSHCRSAQMVRRLSAAARSIAPVAARARGRAGCPLRQQAAIATDPRTRWNRRASMPAANLRRPTTRQTCASRRSACLLVDLCCRCCSTERKG